MENNILEFSYLWDGSSPEWALLLINAGKFDESPEYLIVNTQKRTTLLISDDMTYIQVQERMLNEGIQIVSDGNGW
jgi:hypothetical protein